MTTIHLSQDLLFGSQITSAARSVDVTLERISTPEELYRRVADGDIHGVLIDLSTAVDDLSQLVVAIRQAAPMPVTLIAYGPHVHTQRLRAAEEAGCDNVLTRGHLHRNLAPTLQRMDVAQAKNSHET